MINQWSGLLRRVALARAVRGYRDAMTYVLQLAQRRPFRLSADTILALHYRLQHYDLGKWPGRWRPGEVFVYDADNEVTVYVGPDADQVPELVDQLAAAVNDADLDADPLVTAAMAHLVMIHPFKDGNGRMARCLQTLPLAASGTTLAPELASIEEYLGTHEQDCHRVPAEVGGGEWSPERDTQPWIRFCVTAHYRQAMRVQRRSEFGGKLWMHAEQLVADAGLPDRCVQPLTYCLSGRYLRNSTYRQLVPEKRGRRYLPAEDQMKVATGIRAEVNRRFPVTGDPYA